MERVDLLKVFRFENREQMGLRAGTDALCLP